MTYETLILDIDGTLWDSRGLVAEGYNLQLTEEGLSHLCVNAEILKPLFGKVLAPSPGRSAMNSWPDVWTGSRNT